jgi:hypothetical protein
LFNIPDGAFSFGTHSGDKQTGYVTECECKRVGFVQKSTQKAVKKRKSKPVSYTVIK